MHCKELGLLSAVRHSILVSLWRRANARNVWLYYPYWQYTDLFIFRFVSLLCLRSTLRLFDIRKVLFFYALVCIPRESRFVYQGKLWWTRHLVHGYIPLQYWVYRVVNRVISIRSVSLCYRRCNAAHAATNVTHFLLFFKVDGGELAYTAWGKPPVAGWLLLMTTLCLTVVVLHNSVL